jgi:hypothetical protein
MSSPKVHPANGTDSVDQGLSAPDRKRLGRMTKLWKSDAEHNLKTRHMMGKELIRSVGPPTRRKAHGRRVLEEFGKTLEISPSELNRMGWFFHLFPDYSAFREQHTEIDSWTKFKAALPSLKPVKGGKARKPVKDASRPASRGVFQAIKNLTAKLTGLDKPPVGSEREQFEAALQELAETASRRLKMRIDVVVGVKGNKPVATKRRSRVAGARATANLS